VKRFAFRLLPAILLAACSPELTTPVSSDPSFGREGDPTLSVGAGRIAIVTHDYDSGKGSFRDAIAMANADPRIVRIEVKPQARTIVLASSLVYTGSQALTIIGKQATLDASAAGGPALIATGGGDLHLANLTVANSPKEGIDIEVPAAATGTITVSLDDVTAIDNDGHGVLINDQVDPSTTDGVQPNGAGSAASLRVVITNSRFLRNGFSVSDRDGLRVNEGGLGSLQVTALNVRAEDNAADGIEFDERGEGDVIVDMQQTVIERNGILDPEDLDDGFDIDEYDAGSIIGVLRQVRANNNYEEGLDFNENNAGDLRVDLYDVEAIGNREEGIDYEEDDDFAGGGDLVTIMRDVRANGNGVDGGDAGLKIREKGVGDLNADILRVVASNNVAGGISIREDNVGNLTSVVASAQTLANGSHGIDFDENRANSSDAGNLSATVTQAVSTGNTGAGVRADQQTPGLGTLLVNASTVTPNGAGAYAGNVAPTVTP
jgi:hypothetical protein